MVSELEQVAIEIRKGGGQGLAVPCDVTDAAQVDLMINRVMDEWGRLDILVNNAGTGAPDRSVEEISLEDWDRSIIVNLKSAFLCVRVSVPIMQKQGYGRIVNISSHAGRNFGRQSGLQYGAAKAGLIGFTRNLAVKLGPYGICVNAIAPGMVLTKRVKDRLETVSKEEIQDLISNNPLRRLAQPEEVATVIAFLASDDASYINGVCLDVNGGSYMA
jgi:3-oxoacyl-[acyl-carrier protein] reductase